MTTDSEGVVRLFPHKGLTGIRLNNIIVLSERSLPIGKGLQMTIVVKDPSVLKNGFRKEPN